MFDDGIPLASKHPQIHSLGPWQLMAPLGFAILGVPDEMDQKSLDHSRRVQFI